MKLQGVPARQLPAFVLLLLLTGAQGAFAADVAWTGPDLGNFFTAGNWTGGLQPDGATFNEAGVINNNTTAVVSSGGSPDPGGVKLGQAAGNIGGLRIQRFQVLNAGAEQHFRLRLVLVQSMRQDAVVSGGVGIQIEGVQADRPTQLTLTEVGAKTRADGQLPFQFRYFQNLEQDVVLPAGFEPRAVTVEVHSPRQAAVRESYPWQVLAEG